MKVDSTSTRRWYQLHKSSWFILALAVIALITVNLPYNYVPAYPRRGMTGAFVVRVPLNRSEGERQYGGWPLSYLRVRSGGYYDYLEVDWSTAAMAGDLLVALLLGALVVGAYEQRRRRRTRRWQLTLSDLCFLMLVVCGIFGTWNMMAHRYRTQENAIYQLGIDGGQVTKQFILPKPIVGPDQPSPWRAHFHAWLIEQLWNHERPHRARVTRLTDEVMLALRQLSEIETLVVQNPTVTDDNAVELLKLLPYLERLQIDGAQLTDACVPSLLRLKRLRSLRIREAKLSDEAIAQLAALPRLISLDVEGTPLTDRGLAEIATHQRLRELNIARTKVSEQGLESLNGHPNLTRLWLASDVATPESPGVKRVRLSNLPKLKSLHIPSQIDSLELTNLPSLTKLPCDWDRNDLWQNDIWILEGGFRAFQQVAVFPRPMQNGITAKHVVIGEVPSLETLHLDCRTIESLELDVATLRNISTIPTNDLRWPGQLQATPPRYNLDDRLCELIGRNKALQSLRLCGASLSRYGWEQLSSLEKLNSLDLAGSNVTDETLAGFAKATELQILALAETEISNHGWDKLPRLARLQTLDLSGTQISQLDLEGLSELSTLAIANMPLESLRLKDLPKLAGNLVVTSSAPLIVEVDSLAALQGIYVQHQRVERLRIENLLALTILDLTGSSVDDSMLQDVGQWTSLQSLQLGNTGITDTTLSRLGDLHGLNQLWLNNTAITDEGLAVLGPQLRLTVLNLTGTEVSDRGLQHLGGQKYLSHLYLGGTGVCGPGLQHLSKVTNLQVLSLEETGVTSESLAPLQNFQRLMWLRLSDTKIDDSSFQYLNRLPNLRSLVLDGTSVTDQGFATFNIPRSLRELSLANTGVTAEGIKEKGWNRNVHR